MGVAYNSLIAYKVSVNIDLYIDYRPQYYYSSYRVAYITLSLLYCLLIVNTIQTIIFNVKDKYNFNDILEGHRTMAMYQRYSDKFLDTAVVEVVAWWWSL